MKISIIAIALAIALALPVAAQAASCGVPQGYGTSNPNTFNRSTCGPTGNNSNSYATPNAANQAEVLAEAVRRRLSPRAMERPIPMYRTAARPSWAATPAATDRPSAGPGQSAPVDDAGASPGRSIPGE